MTYLFPPGLFEFVKSTVETFLGTRSGQEGSLTRLLKDGRTLTIVERNPEHETGTRKRRLVLN